jgi:CO/xanthine dehydrogenase FAD-binding subunit
MTTQVLDVTGEGRIYPLLPLLARTATPTAFQLEGTQRNTAMVVVLGVTALSVGASVTVTVAGWDPNSQTSWPIISSAAVTAAGTTVLKISPGITTATNVAVADILPPQVLITVTHANSDSITYALSAHVTN